MPQLKKPFRMPRVAHAPPNKQRPYGRFRQETNCRIVRKLAGIRSVVHLSKLIRPNHVHILSYKWRQRQNVVQIAGTEIVVLIAEELIRSVSAQTRWSAEKKLWHADIIRTECGAALGHDENRSRLRDGHKIFGLRLHHRKRVARSRIRVVPAKACLRAVASARRNEIVAMVGDKAKALTSKAAIIPREKLRANPQIGVEVTHFVTCADFRKPAEAVADVDSRVVAEEAVNRLWRASVKHLKRSVRSFSPRGEKPFAGCRKRPIQLSLDSVLVSELQIGTPFRAIAPHIHESNARELRVSHIVAFCAVDRKAELQNGRSVAVFMNRNHQAALAIAGHKAKIRRGIFANSREPDQKLV